MAKFTSIEELQIVLDIHRKKAFVTCSEDCLCWDIESYLAGVEANQQSVQWTGLCACPEEWSVDIHGNCSNCGLAKSPRN